MSLGANFSSGYTEQILRDTLECGSNPAVPSSTEVKTPPTEVSRLPAGRLPVLPRLQNLRSQGSSISYPAVYCNIC